MNCWADTIQIVTDPSASALDVYDGTVAWHSRSAGKSVIKYWNGSTVQTINWSGPNPLYTGITDAPISLQDGQIAFVGITDMVGFGDFRYDVLFWNGSTVTQVTDQKYATKPKVSLWNGLVAFEADNSVKCWSQSGGTRSLSNDFGACPSAYKEQVTWLEGSTLTSRNRLNMWDGSSKTYLGSALDPGITVNQWDYVLHGASWANLWYLAEPENPPPKYWLYYDEVNVPDDTRIDYVVYPDGPIHDDIDMYDGHVVWAKSDGNDYEIFYWDGVNVTQITDNSTDDLHPAIYHASPAQIVWIGQGGNVFFTVVPEPSALLLVGIGCAALAGRRIMKHRTQSK
ncbi:MAG TPA: PEP-CTERM sorting domain-containing protein [Candidatus Brocadiia bacterium]|nr:PEP-CTERM sorting domain-containing protein [Candidatus Brocadiia bacterium]